MFPACDALAEMTILMVYVVVLYSLSKSTNEKQLQGENNFLSGGVWSNHILAMPRFWESHLLHPVSNPRNGLDMYLLYYSSSSWVWKTPPLPFVLVRKKKTARSCFSRRSLSITGVHSCLTRIFYQLHQDLTHFLHRDIKQLRKPPPKKKQKKTESLVKLIHVFSEFICRWENWLGP